MDTLKSLTVINTTAGWAVRLRTQAGIELFGGMVAENGHRFTKAEAEAFAHAKLRDIGRHGLESQLDGMAALAADIKLVV